MKNLLLGCGSERRPGWLHVDADVAASPDLLARPDELDAVPDGAVELLEVALPLTALDLATARRAFAEWRRVLAPGGALTVHTPDAAVAAAQIGRRVDGVDQGLAALFGHPGRIAVEGEAARRRWAWTRADLEAELTAAGFASVHIRPSDDFQLIADCRTAGDPEPALGRPADRSHVAPPSGEPPRPTEADGRIVLAWPNYADSADLDGFFRTFAGILSDRDDATLALLFDLRQDGDRQAVLDSIGASHARTLGADTPLSIGLVEAPRDVEGWSAITDRCAVRVALSTDVRRGAFARLGLATVNDPGQLTELINGAADDGTPRGVLAPAGGTLDLDLARRAAALHPWFYPVELDDHVVVPGIGSPCSAEYLTSRAYNRSKVLADGVLAAVDVRGKRLLDLACNCAFWTSYWARAGAASVVGLEGRERHVEQARLYWDANRFLPEGRAEFVRGNIADAADWAPIRDRGPYDVTLCAGILYHVENYAEILRWAAAVTTETLVVDTRVQDGPEEVVDEGGDVQFNAIAQTRRKVTPNRTKLLSCLRELGFEPTVLDVPFESELGVDHADDYAAGARVTIVAHKVAVPAPASLVGGGSAQR